MLTVKSSDFTTNYKAKTYILLIFFALFFPGMVSTFGLMLEQGLTIVLFGVCLLLMIAFRFKLPLGTLTISFFIYIYFQLSIIISLLRSTDIIITSDIVEVFKPMYMYSFFLLPFCLIKKTSELKVIIRYFFIFCVLLALFGIFEAWTSLGYTISTLLYKPSREVLHNKAVASFIITYTFASFMVLPFFYFLTKAFSKKNIFNISLLISLVCLFCIFSTQSKTVFISLAFTLLLYFLLYILYGFTIYKKRLVIMISIVTIITFVSVGILLSVFSDAFSYTYKGLEIVTTTLFDEGIKSAIYSTPSLSLRYEQFLFALDQQDSIPLIGVAIGKGVLMPESIYALYLYRVGIIGLLLHFLIVFYLVYKSFLCARYFAKNNDIHMYSWFMAIHFYALSLPLSYFSSAVNDQTRTGFIFYFIVGSTMFVSKNIKVK